MAVSFTFTLASLFPIFRFALLFMFWFFRYFFLILKTLCIIDVNNSPNIFDILPDDFRFCMDGKSTGKN